MMATASDKPWEPWQVGAAVSMGMVAGALAVWTICKAFP